MRAPGNHVKLPIWVPEKTKADPKVGLYLD